MRSLGVVRALAVTLALTLAVAGCGSSKSKSKSSSSSSKMHHASTSGKYHAGEFCSTKKEAIYHSHHLVCSHGRLKKV